MNVSPNWSWRVTVALLFVIAGSVVARAGSPPTYYLYKHQRVPLQLNEDALSVRYHTDKAHPQQLREAASVGVGVSSATPMSIVRWHLLNLQTPLSDGSDADNRIRKLQDGSDVEFVSPVFKGKNGSPIMMTPEVLVKFKPEHLADATSLLETITPELTVVEESYGGMPGAYRLKSKSRNGFDVLASANKLAEGGYTEWAEPDMIFSGEHDLIPNDPSFGRLWGINNTGQSGGVAGMDMKGDLAWNITMGDTSVKVMVIDCGVQQNHPDIHQLPGLDFTGQGGNGGPVNSCDNHGTAVAGCVSATINNGVGIAGIAPNCYVVSARTLIANSSCDNSFSSQISWTVNALAYAASHGIRITNFSNQFWVTSSALEAEYQYTHDNAGMVHFAASGNGSTSVYYPASIPVVNAVGALNNKGVLASFSNTGSALDFTAPGDSIYVTDRTGSAGYTNGDYYMYRGTSFASPYAAGVAALILSRFPSFTAQQVEAKMRNSSVDLGPPGFDSGYGWGFVNAYNAVRSSCILTPPANISVPVDPGQCGAVVSFPSPTTSGNCGPVTSTPPSGSFFSVGPTTVSCSDTSGNQCTFTVTVNGGNLTPAVLRDDFNRANGALPGSNKWSLIQNQPNSGSMSIVNNAIQPVSSSGNYNFGGVVWDSLMGPGTEVSLTLTQKSGDFNNSSFFIYARMNNKDFNTGTGYRLRYLDQSGTDNVQIQSVGPGYGVSTLLASASYEVNPGDVVTFRVLCNNQAMVALVNGNQIMSVLDAAYTPSQWYYAVRGCVLPTPVRLDNFKVSPAQLAPPLPPALLSPSTGATNQPVSLTLSWNQSAGATSYRVQVASDPGFGTVVLDDSTVAGTSRQVGPLSNNTTYFWHVSAKNNIGGSAYSSTWNFTTIIAPPSPPVLQSPASGSVNQATTLTLTWNASATAATHRVQVSTDSLFGSTVLNDSTISGTSRQVGPLANGTRYFWRVNAKNAGGTSAYSSAWSFTTIALPPPAPVLASPATGATNQPATLTLSWNPSIGASSYHVQVSTDSLFGSTILDDSTVAGTSRQAGPLSDGTVYYWHVSAKNGAGVSAYYSTWNFTTLIAPPSPPVLQSPASGSVNQATTLTLTWNASATAATYRVQVSTDSLFGTTVLNDSTVAATSRQVGPLANSMKYFWRVNAKNASGTSAYSAVWSFTTITGPPSAPALASPANGAINQPTTVTLSWNPSSGASSYRVQVSTDSLFATTLLDDSTVAGTSRQVGPLGNGTRYFWRVNAKNAGGTSLYSPVWSFTTIPTLPAQPVLTSPANGAACQPSTVTLTWAASSGASTYRLQLATDSLFAAITVDDSTITTTSRPVSSLAGGRTYYWHVSATNAGGTSAYSPDWRFATFLPGTLRDNFNRPDGPLAGANKWALILNHPSASAMNILGNAIQPFSSAGVTNFGGDVWDSLASAGSEASLTILQKGGNFVYTSLFIYAKMNNKDYNTGVGYRLRYFEQSGTDILEIHRVGPGYPNSTTIGSKSIEINVGDVLTFRVLCDNKTLVALVNGVQALSVVDSLYMPSQWYFAVRACVFSTPVRFDDFQISGPPPVLSSTRPVILPEETPGGFVLQQNYPDPFNPATTLSYSLQVDASVQLRIYNILGQEVRTLVDAIQSAGVKRVEWNSTSSAGVELPSGVYFYELNAQALAGDRQSFRQVKKMLLVR